MNNMNNMNNNKFGSNPTQGINKTNTNTNTKKVSNVAYNEDEINEARESLRLLNQKMSNKNPTTNTTSKIGISNTSNKNNPIVNSNNSSNTNSTMSSNNNSYMNSGNSMKSNNQNNQNN